MNMFFEAVRQQALYRANGVVPELGILYRDEAGNVRMQARLRPHRVLA
jgi:hypothetical protein